MSALFLLFPILLPIAGGLAIIPLGFTDDAKRNRYAEAVVVLTSVLAFACIALCGRDSAELYRFTAGFSIAFSIDFLSCLFGGMVALMWPLVMVYAFSEKDFRRRPKKTEYLPEEEYEEYSEEDAEEIPAEQETVKVKKRRSE